MCRLFCNDLISRNIFSSMEMLSSEKYFPKNQIQIDIRTDRFHLFCLYICLKTHASFEIVFNKKNSYEWFYLFVQLCEIKMCLFVHQSNKIST